MSGAHGMSERIRAQALHSAALVRNARLEEGINPGGPRPK